MRAKGFTLLELLVSISIFSVLGMGAYQMLQTVSETHERVRASLDGYTSVNLALSIIQRDFNQFVPRQVRDEYGEPLAPMVFGSGDYLVEFTRAGWTNPAGRPRSELQRVAYSLDYEEETLTRHFWKVLDRAEDSKPVSQVLLTGVTEFRVTGFTRQGENEQDDLSLDEMGGVAPLAVEVVVSTESLGDVERLFQLVDPFFEVSRQGGNAGDNQENDLDEGQDDNIADRRIERAESGDESE